MIIRQLLAWKSLFVTVLSYENYRNQRISKLIVFKVL